MTLFVALVVFLLTIESQVANSGRPSVDILIPKGMPIRIKAEREVNDPGIVKYVFTRIVSKDAHRARISKKLWAQKARRQGSDATKAARRPRIGKRKG